MDITIVRTLMDAARPFLRIDGIQPISWCRNVQTGPRFGPWKYEAVFVELDSKVWSRQGEVLYFVTDRQQQLRLVGESGGRLKDRWRLSPMHDVSTRAPIGRKALFHSTAWAAIECGFEREAPPFTVSAIFPDDLASVLDKHDAMDHLPRTSDHLSRRAEEAIIASLGGKIALWNKKGVVQAATFAA